MREKAVTKISVRSLVEFVMQSGDLSSGFASSSRLVDGIKAHQLVSKTSLEDYRAEVSISYTVEREDMILEISGRIDGVITMEDGIKIDEIKSTSDSLENIYEDYNLMHWAQAKCYAYIYCIQNQLEIVTVQLTYIQIDTSELKYFQKEFNAGELEIFFFELVDKHLKWLKVLQEWNNFRNTSIKQIEFPFQTYRKGQRELATSVYRSIRDNGKLFVQAPTGIGKTIATLFPAVKAMGEGLTSKIFYLTAKTITRTIAEKAIDKMRSTGLKVKALTITAKEKACLNGEVLCNPEVCKFARGYFDRVNKAIEDIFKLDSFTRDVIEEYAIKHGICPFEFSLDLSLWCDCIICDYNYVFDPRVHLKRYFMNGGGDYTFLIDEAHNLVDRAREMFSAELLKKPVLELKRETKKALPRLSKCLNEINSLMIEARKECGEDFKGVCLKKEVPKDLYGLLKKVSIMAENWLKKNEQSEFSEKLLEFYFQASNFIKIFEGYDERYITYFEKSDGDLKIKMFCLDPSYLLEQAMKRGKSAILFSATLTPLNYFMKILGGGEESVKLRLSSPFPRENLCLLVEDNISTKFKMREYTYDKITKSISDVVNRKVGNYLIFFPSYQYMNEIFTRFVLLDTDIKVIYQKPGMSEGEREEFLQQFSAQRQQSLVGFAVMGGIFGEGIDLVGDRLLGAIVVGVGLPQICLERDIIRNYFEEENGNGFEYAYMYPGMNKVMQAVGRVIRTEEDRGVVLLVDERFSYPAYRELYPPEWQHAVRVEGPEEVEEILEEFWN